jgi:signal transduction histidine kinase
MWVLMVVVPMDGSAAATAVARLALVPTALLAVAIMDAGGPPAGAVARTCEVVAVLTALVAGSGHYRFALLAIGLGVLVVGVAGREALGHGDRRRRAAVMLQAGFGTGAMTVGALVALPLGADRAVTGLHAVVMVLGCAGLCAVTSRPALLGADALELDTPGWLGAALGRALDRPPVSIALPKGDGTWLDAGGREVEPRPDQAPWRSQDGNLLARISDPGEMDPQQRRAVDRMLAAAVEGARLRADLRDRATALDASRGRLLTAAADERARLATLIERGPLARLDRIGALTPLMQDDPLLAARREAATTSLGSVLRGLDPTAPGLEAALRALAEDTGATVCPGSTWPAPGRLDPARSRAVWFVCAEALVNAAKHAPGAQVEVLARTTADAVEVQVRDDGPGGAQPAGSGLTGLSERASSVGGRLRVRSGPRGTEVAFAVPLTDRVATGKPSAATARTRMPTAAPAGRVAP